MPVVRRVLLLSTFVISTLCLIDLSVRASDDLQWWQKSIVYQIYPRSFQDSDGDGVGDIRGIIQRLDHFEYLGVEAIWLSPVYDSPMADFGYDISNFTGIDPQFGTMQDMDDLIEEIHSRGMKLIMDYIPNHSSNQHPWFLESRLGGEDNKYADYYCWHSGKVLENGTRVPPNNWLSVFGGTAWTWEESRQMYYLHQFAPEQPDLNYHNPSVRQDMLDVFQFWIDRGVDGFRIDALQNLYEAEHLQDEPPSNRPGILAMDTFSLDHIYTQHQQKTYEAVRIWRNHFDEYERKTGKHIFVVIEVYADRADDVQSVMKFYGYGADMPFNFNLIEVNSSCNALCFKALIDRWMNEMPPNQWPNFVTGNHDRGRMVNRKGTVYASALNVLLLTLPGTPTTYQGEEIGQPDAKVSWEQTVDPWGKNFGEEGYEMYSRDPCRGPIQWSSENNAGFSTNEETWLPINPDYESHNIEEQKNDPSGLSVIQVYKATANLRKEPSFQNNELTYAVVEENILSYFRGVGSHPTYLVALNFGDQVSTADFTSSLKENQQSGTLVILTGKIIRGDEQLKIGDEIDLTRVELRPGEGFVVKLANSNEKEEL